MPALSQLNAFSNFEFPTQIIHEEEIKSSWGEKCLYGFPTNISFLREWLDNTSRWNKTVKENARFNTVRKGKDISAEPKDFRALAGEQVYPGAGVGWGVRKDVIQAWKCHGEINDLHVCLYWEGVDNLLGNFGGELMILRKPNKWRNEVTRDSKKKSQKENITVEFLSLGFE